MLNVFLFGQIHAADEKCFFFNHCRCISEMNLRQDRGIVATKGGNPVTV